MWGFSWWLGGKEFACQSRRQGFNLWSRKIPHNMEPSLCPCAATTEAHVPQSPGSTIREATAMRSLSTATKSSPNSRQLDKSPCSTEDPQINKFIYKKRHVSQIILISTSQMYTFFFCNKWGHLNTGGVSDSLGDYCYFWYMINIGEFLKVFIHKRCILENFVAKYNVWDMF